MVLQVKNTPKLIEIYVIPPIYEFFIKHQNSQRLFFILYAFFVVSHRYV